MIQRPRTNFPNGSLHNQARTNSLPTKFTVSLVNFFTKIREKEFSERLRHYVNHQRNETEARLVHTIMTLATLPMTVRILDIKLKQCYKKKDAFSISGSTRR